MIKTLLRSTVAAALLGVTAVQQARAFTHPCAPTTLEELDTIKANLDKQPWKSGYAALAADGKSQLGYVMGGPFQMVTRNPDENLWPWRNDMVAFYNLARMWYFTGNEGYAQKAHDIIIAWATTHKVFGGNESGLDLGDYALCYGNGASILRGTWPGWTQQDTITVQNYFRNVLWPATAAPYNVSGPANKGSLNLVAGAVIAVFCDDTGMFNHVVDVFRNYPGSGLPNILATGQMGETGRDMGHGFNDLLARTLTAEILWKQGVDVYSESDNRLLAAGEYHARNTSVSDTPFVPYGTVDYNYYQNSGAPSSQDRATYYLLQNAYKNRLGLPTPWIDQKLTEAGVHGGNFMFAKTVDFSTATPPPADPRPAVSPASGGLTLTTLGTQTTGRSASYANGVWTVTGLGNGAWSDVADDCQFVYKAMTGDCAMVAQVTSVTYSGSQNGKMGLMIRDNLIGTVSQRSWIGIVPTESSGNLIEARSTGWTVTWGGSNWAKRSQGLPLPLPYWLKIERKGNVITSYTSQDGTTWSPTISSDFGNLPATVYVGIHVSSGTTTPNTATFANLSYTGGTGGLVNTPAAPAAMLASGSGKAITLRWLPSFGATAYDILRSTTSGSGYTVIASDLTADKTSYVDTTVSSGTTYYYVARAKNSAGTSGNSPEFYASLRPTQLINLALNGTSDVPSAFDDNFGSFWFNVGTTGSLQYDFGANSAQVIKRYTMVSAPLIPERDPKDWQFQGSNDGSTWTPLDTQTNQTFQGRAYQRVFDISNTTAYRYYRLNVTANNGDGAFLHLSELGLWGDSGRVVPSGSYVLASRHANKVVDLAAGSTVDGTATVQSSWAATDTQRWQLDWQGDGLYRATNVATQASDAKALDNGGSATAGDNLVIQPLNGGTSQLWKITPDGDGFFRVESANSGLVTDVSGGSAADGANLVQSTYNGSDSQQWRVGVAATPQPPPPGPTSLVATAASTYQINLSWTASPGAVSCHIKRATVSGGPYTTLSTGVNGTSYADDDLSSSTTYYYVVSAVNGSGEGADSAQAQATTLTGPPPAPTNLTAILGTGQASLSWTPTNGAMSYTIKRTSTSGGPYTTLATGLTGTTYIDTTFTSDTAYHYVVVANNADGSGPDSAEVSVGPGTLVVHLAFDETGGLLAADSSGGGHDATLVSGANFAPGLLDNALMLPATSGQYAQLPSGIASGLTDFTLAAWVRVDAFTTWSRIFDFGTDTNNNMFLAAQGPAGAGRPRFSIRTSGVAEQVIDSSIALTAGAWTHIAVTRSGNTVSLYLNGSLAGSGTITISPTDLGFTTRNYLGKSQFNDPSLKAALDDFRLYAQAMSPAEITTLAHPPVGTPRQLAADSGNNQVTLSWLPDATLTYSVKRASTAGGPYTTIATGLTATTYTDTGLTNGVTYYYVVSGANGSDTGPDSAEVSITPSTLRLHLKFDEDVLEDAVAADSSGRAKDATLLNSPTFGPGKLDNALTFNAASSQYATLPDGIVSGLTDFTVATWIKVNTFATWQRIFDFGTGTNNYMFLTTQYSPTSPNNAKLRFGIRTPSAAEQDVNGTDIALTADAWTHVAVTRSGTTLSIYVNGSLAGSGTIALSPTDLGLTTLNYLGKSQFNDPYLNAALDDFRIYSQALDASEIASLVTGQANVPQAVTATGGDAQITLAWQTVAAATGYNVKRSTDSGGLYTVLSTTSASGYTDTGLSAGATYYYVVSANTTSGESADSLPVSATTISPAPTGLTTTNTNGQVNLAWDASPGATGYTIRRATSPDGPFTSIATGVTGTSYIDTSAQSGATYYYTVAAGNDAGESASSASVAATAPFTAVTWLKLDEITGATAADAIGGGDGTLVNGPLWTGGRIGNALSFNGTNQHVTLPTGIVSSLQNFTVTAWVYWNGGGNWQRIFDFGSGTTSYMFLTPTYSATGKIRFAIRTAAVAEQTIDGTAALPTSGWHHVAVTLAGTTGTLYVDGQQVGQNTAMTLHPSDLGATTQNRLGRSQFNDPYFNGRLDDVRIYSSALGAAEITALAEPIQTTGLTATGGTGQIALTWDATPGATTYTVRRATTSGGPYATVASALVDTAYTDTDVTDGATYDYVVTPANSVTGDGANSAEVSAIAISLAPTNLAATVSSGQVDLTWTASGVATGYLVQRSLVSGGPYTTIATLGATTSYSDTGLVDGNSYHYIITAVQGATEIADSAELTAIPGVVTDDWFTELFTSGDLNDTANSSYTFTPAANANGYIVVRDAATAFSTDPTGGTTLNLGDDASTAVTLSGGKQVSLFGTAYSTFYVGSNGYVTFGSGDDQYAENLANHFNLPRVSPLFDDLDPTAGGTISWKQLADRVAITWQAVSEYSAGNANTFQVELFFDGRVRITILSIAATDGLIGLSRGTGTPSGFVESNFSAYAGLPSAPDNLAAAGGPGQIALSWSAESGATGYRIARATTSEGPYTVIAASADAAFTDLPLSNGTTYYYAVSAVNAVGEGSESTPASGTSYTAQETWRFTNFGTTANSGNAADNADPDGDGMTNAQEFASGTAPNDPASVLKIDHLQTSGGDMVVSFPTVSGKTYRVEYSDTLAAGSWTTMLDNIAGTGGALQVTDVGAASVSKRFYRIVLLP